MTVRCWSLLHYFGSDASYCRSALQGVPSYTDFPIEWPSISNCKSLSTGAIAGIPPASVVGTVFFMGNQISLSGTGWSLTLAVLFVAASLQVDLSKGDAGECPNKICSIAGYCCSQYFHCGTNISYCGLGCQGGACCSTPDCISSGLGTGTIAGIVVASLVGTLLLLGTILFIAWRRRRGTRKRDEAVVQDSEARVGAESLANVENDQRLQSINSLISSPWKRLSFETLNSATNVFSHELGRGAFGVVYKGTLDDGTEIAVKKLIDDQRDAKDFEAEVKTLGSINHTNLVALLGFTIDHNELFLIYEFVAKGSLDQWIFANRKSDRDFVLPWQTRVDILRGTARGLAYLHEELQGGKAIVHLDIKPQNILLDESFVPKIADFGLAKLLGSETTRQTLAAGGTMGYMAPEVYVGVASPEMDVYSFGMVLLEVVSGREHLDQTSSMDSVYLPSWAIRKVHQGKALDVVDPLLEEGEFDANLAPGLIRIALLCLQRDPYERPDMSSVLRMMEGYTIPQALPPTLQQELEIVEKIVRGRPAKDSMSSGNLRRPLLTF